MRYIDSIDSLDLFPIESHLDCTFHHISDSIVREPSIDENTNIFTIRVRYIDEEFRMSEWSDNHRYKENPLFGDFKKLLFWEEFFYQSSTSHHL